jgi:hypothetical protein
MAQTASYAGKLREEWMRRTWELGQHPDSTLLIDMRGRADAHLSLAETTYDRWVELSNDPAA